MNTVTVPNKGKHTTKSEYRAQRPLMTVPKIKRKYWSGKGKDRTLMYETECGRTFFADAYDRNFKVNHGIKMKPKNFKGKSLDGRIIY